MEEIKKYMLIEDRIVTAFYSTDVNENIPEGTVEISEQLWQKLLQFGQARLKNNKKQNFAIEDFEENIIEPTEEEIQKRKVQEAQHFLNDTDYVVVKMAEYATIGKTIDNDYTEVLHQREEAREIIRNAGAESVVE